MIKIAVSGSKGKMGGRILALAKDDPDFEVVAAFDVGEDAASQIKKCDCLIEFTTPEATVEHLGLCVKSKKAMVIGTTGLSREQEALVREAAGKAAVVFSPNMSIGVNLLFKMVSDAAKTLGPEYQVAVLEAHHEHKKDAPSGTAKEISRIVKAARPGADVPIESVREGEIVGEHTVTFESHLDLIEITHSAKTRDIFAKGALLAAKFAAGKGAGLYTMREVLEL